MTCLTYTTALSCHGLNGTQVRTSMTRRSAEVLGASPNASVTSSAVRRAALAGTVRIQTFTVACLEAFGVYMEMSEASGLRLYRLVRSCTVVIPRRVQLQYSDSAPFNCAGYVANNYKS